MEEEHTLVRMLKAIASHGMMLGDRGECKILGSVALQGSRNHDDTICKTIIYEQANCSTAPVSVRR